MLWTIIGILLLAWLLGFIFEIAGGLIHILLVIALVVFIARMIKGR
ncbi:MAG TPA: lmo0937 family membrane protein [Bacilli bacterium]|nr:lmo0937 family membrane protein [Bacilli bacterium]